MATNMLETSEYANNIQLLNYVSYSHSEVWEYVRDFLSLKGKPFGDEVIKEEKKEESKESITA